MSSRRNKPAKTLGKVNPEHFEDDERDEEEFMKDALAQIQALEAQDDMAEKPSPSKMSDKKLVEVDQKNTPQQVKHYKVVNGMPPVDEYVPDREKYQVYGTSATPYSKTLTSTSISDNSNKFYIIQLLEKLSAKTYFTFYRWGRIGKPGSTKLNSFGTSIGQALMDYNDKVKAKLDEGDYDEVNVAYTEDDGEASDSKMLNSVKTCSVDAEVAELIKNLFSIKMFTQQVQQIGFDVKRMPLGKLSQESIKRGYEALRLLLHVLEFPKEERANQVEICTNNFYRAIPHDIGFGHAKVMSLDTQEKVAQKLDLLDTLAQIKVAKGALDEETHGTNSIDFHYKKLGITMKTVPLGSDEGKRILKYVETTTDPMHASLKVAVETIFSLDKLEETANLRTDVGNRKLLFHGSRMTNFAGILSQGLQVPPPDAPTTGFAFGRGIYFTDTFSNALMQCFLHLSNGVGYALLCEVALGNTQTAMMADYAGTGLKEGKDSISALGRTAPDSANAETSFEHVTFSFGPLKPSQHRASMFQFNQYVVYKTNQVKMRYLLKFKQNK